MRVLVTGGSGFLGSHVAERLAAKGHEVRCLVRKSSKTDFLESLSVTLVDGAVDKPASLVAAVAGVDAIVHCAGLVKAKAEEEFVRVHEGGTRALAEAAIAHAPDLRRFVHVSTAAVMGSGTEGKKFVESDTPNPGTRYAKSKLLAEHALLSLKDRLPITILRPPAIYGPRDQEILAFFRMIRRSRLAVRLGDSMRSLSMVYGADCADACILAIGKDVPSGSTYFVEDGNVYSFDDLARGIAAAYEKPLLGMPRVPEGIIRAAAEVSEAYGRIFDQAMMFNRDKLNELFMQHFVLDGRRIRDELGFVPRTAFADGARTTAAWYREHRWD